MRGSKREIIHLFIDSSQNQAETQQNSEQLKQEKGGIDKIRAEERENHQPNEGKSKSEEQSKTLESHQTENGGKSETTHEEMADDEPEAASNRVEERESEDRNGGGGPRERLKRHRTEVAGHVWIPDMWGQEELLMDWIDCSAFDACLMPQGIISARTSLIKEGRRANSSGITVENSC